MPDGPRPYQQMLRGPRYRWWKPLLCLLLFLLLFLLMAMLAIVPVLIAGLVSGAPDLVAYTDPDDNRHCQPWSDRLHLPQSQPHRADPGERPVDLDRAWHSPAVFVFGRRRHPLGLAASLHRGHPAAVGALYGPRCSSPCPSPLRGPTIG